MPAKHGWFVFTHNNYTDEDIEKYVNLSWATYVIFGRETAPSSGTPHLQGALWTPDFKTLQQIKRKLPGAAVFTCGSTKPPKYWQEYCSKQDDTFHEHGTPPTEEEFLAQVPKGQGARSDLLSVKKKLEEGTNLEDLQEEDEHFSTVAVHSKFLAQYQSHLKRRKCYQAPKVYVIYGPTGTDKTRTAYEACPPGDTFIWSPQMGSWFDGYHGQSHVVFDEFRGQIPWGMLLNITDGYPTKVQIKCGMVHWSPKVIYFTSPVNPAEWYSTVNAKDNYAQLARRISTITCTGPPQPTHEDQFSQ